MSPLSSDQPLPDDGRHDERRTSPPSRRAFLKGLGVITAGGMVATIPGTAFRKGAFAASGSTGHVLVVVNLRGGSDGMSLVVPYGDPGYALARPTIAVPPSTLLQTDGQFGLHPSLAALEPMWAGGVMAAVHAVGYLRSNAANAWATGEVRPADPGPAEATGWMDQLAAMVDPSGHSRAVQIDGLPGHTAGARPRRHGAAASGHGAGYPPTHLGEVLAQAAQLIRSDTGVVMITVQHWPWDMTADLGTYKHGRMHRMVTDLAESVAAFFADLGALGSRVTLLTTSEFGRKVSENGEGGVDDGYGNATLVMGAGVRGGRVYGTWPGCGVGQQTSDGSLKVTTDYRSVLSEVAASRFPVVRLPILFPGFEPGPVGVMRSV
jgi:uncharacterized protein (DUF1501 family)